METNELPLVDVANPLDVINYAQQKRLEILATEEMSTKDKALLLAGLTTTALGQLKVKQEESNAESNKQLSIAMAQHFTKLMSDPFRIDTVQSKVIQSPEVPAIVPLPDETSTKLSSLTYNDFMVLVETTK